MVKSKPFWEIINKASESTAEIRIYSDIVSEKPWYDSWRASLSASASTATAAMFLPHTPLQTR